MGCIPLPFYKTLDQSMEILIFLFCHWYLSLFFQTFFLHRYASHNMFKMSPFWEKTFFFLTFIFQGSSFLHPAAYSVMHRRHHSFADTPKDPHSPVHLKNIISFNLATVNEYRKLVNEFLKGGRTISDAPRWYTLEWFAESVWTRVAFIILYFLLYFMGWCRCYMARMRSSNCIQIKKIKQFFLLYCKFHE